MKKAKAEKVMILIIPFRLFKNYTDFPRRYGRLSIPRTRAGVPIHQPSTIRYCPFGSGNTSLASSISSRDIPSTSIPFSSK